MAKERSQAQQQDNHEPASAEKIAAQEKTPSPASSYLTAPGLSISGAASADDIPITRSNILMLQRTIGNRAVVRLLQRKTKISQPGDAYEQEADRVAERVMSMPEPSRSKQDSTSSSTDDAQIQRADSGQGAELGRQSLSEDEKRKRPEEEGMVQTKLASTVSPLLRQAMTEEERKKRPEEEETIQAKEESGQTPALTPKLESQINSLQGGGEPLPDSVRADFEPRFGVDFSDVRVHKGSQAAESAQAINARAYTTGRDVVFGANEYAPDTGQGKRLLAHELTHVVQQGGASQSQLNRRERTQGQIQMKANDAQVSNLDVTATAVLQRNGGGQSKLDELNEKLDKFDVPEEEVIALCGQLNAAEKATVLAGGYRSRMASALNVSEMVQAVNNLGAVLSTKLEWVNEASLLTSSIEYAEIGGMVRSAPQGERDALKIDFWKEFFVKVCTNATMVEALNDLGFDLATKLRWLQAEMTVTSLELDYSTIKPWITGASQADRDALKTEEWKSFFVKVCTNTTMVEALNDLGFDLATKLRWLHAEMTVTSLELDYSTIKPWIIAASQGDRDAMKTDEGKSFFVKVCNDSTIVDAVTDLNFDLATKVNWIVAETLAGSSTLSYPFENVDEGTLASIRTNSSLIDALQKVMTEQEFARAAAAIILITPPDVVDKNAAKAEALRVLSVMLNSKEIARGTLKGNMIAVIIPRNKLLTDVAQFSHLAGKTTFDGRKWETVRGVRTGDKVAMTEENLLGGASTATFNGNPVGAGYPVGYSSASHEFAHGLHVNVLSSADKTIITSAYQARKALATASPADPTQWVDGREGCYASQNEREFFAQLSNAYLGINAGTDAATGDPRHNGKAWVQANEPTVYAVLQRMYGTGDLTGANPARP